MDNLLVIANTALWFVILALGLLVYVLTRQLAVLYDRVAPAGALTVNQQLAVGDAAPNIEVQSLTGDLVQIGGERARPSSRGRSGPDAQRAFRRRAAARRPGQGPGSKSGGRASG